MIEDRDVCDFCSGIKVFLFVDEFKSSGFGSRYDQGTTCLAVLPVNVERDGRFTIHAKTLGKLSRITNRDLIKTVSRR
jgi:hypothetical protein